jgi:hypothetical protein
MPLLVTSAAGANGNGYGTLLAFDLNGRPLGAFSGDSRIADPRGLAVDRDEGLLFLNSGTDRVLALDPNGRVVRDSGPIEGLNPGGGNFGPDGRYYVGARSARTIMAFSIGLGDLCCVAQDEVVAFDFISGECLGVIVRLPRLNGQALAFFP